MTVGTIRTMHGPLFAVAITIFAASTTSVLNGNVSDLNAQADKKLWQSVLAMADGRFAEAKQAAQESLELATEADDAERQFKANSLLAQIEVSLGETQAATIKLLRLRIDAAESGDFGSELRSLLQLAELAEKNDALAEAVSFYTEARQVTEENGTNAERFNIEVKLARLYHQLAADEKAQQALANAKALYDVLDEEDRENGNAWLLVLDDSAPLSALANAADTAERSLDRGSLWLEAAMRLLHEGRLQDAADTFEMAFPDFQDLNLQHVREAQYHYATALIGIDRKPDAQIVIKRLLESLKTPTQLVSRALSLQLSLIDDDTQHASILNRIQENDNAVRLMRSRFLETIANHRKQLAAAQERERVQLVTQSANFQTQSANYRTYLWVSVIGAASLCAFMFFVIRIRSKQKLMEAEMRHEIDRSAARQERFSAIGRLASGVAHDFNNLMTVIYSISETVYKNTEQRLDEQERDMLCEVLKATESGVEITKQLLALSRGSVAEEDFCVVEHLRSTKGLLTRTLGDNIQLEIRHLETTPWLTASKARFMTVIINLCANARDAITTDGQVEIIIDAAGTEADYFTLTVRDNGHGMQPEHLAKATSEGFTTKQVDEGTGLGLGMVEDFATAVGGKIEISSQVGEGTEVTLTLPRASAVHQSSDAALCVVVVHPVASVLTSIREVLEYHSCEVHTALDEEAGQSLLEGDLFPDAILVSGKVFDADSSTFQNWLAIKQPDVPVIETIEESSEFRENTLTEPFTYKQLCDALSLDLEATKVP